MEQMSLENQIEEQIKIVRKNYDVCLRSRFKGDCNYIYYGGRILNKWTKHGSYDSCKEHLIYCGEIGNEIYDFLLEKGFNVKCVEGVYVGIGAKFSPDQSGGHVWVELADGTIIDGAFKQYQDPSLGKKRKRLNIVRPNDPQYKDYQKDCQ